MSAREAAGGPRTGYRWAAKGDVNAFFGLMLDNISGMIIATALLVNVFHFPVGFVVGRMIPGTALGVLVGDLVYTVMAFALARRSGRDVTAMPLGLDTPSIFGTSLMIVGPAYVAALGRGLGTEAAARHAWYIGIAMLLASGVFKLALAPATGWIRRIVPRAGLLGSLAGIALVVISFLPLQKVVGIPVAGLAALAVILASLTAGWRLPRGVPGALAAVVVGCAVYYAIVAGQRFFGWPGPPAVEAIGGGLRFALPFPMVDWWSWFQGNWREALGYLTVAIPLALATIVGGIDCTESAAAAGDDYATGRIIGVEGFATLVAGLFGGIIQTTPYIGHPAYKAMGGRAAYTLATAVCIGVIGMMGAFGWIFRVVPEAVVAPILMFIALEITAQSFAATPRRHYPALALACVPALGYLVKIALDQVLGDPGMAAAGGGFAALSLGGQQVVQTTMMLSGGFIVTSLLWSTALAKLIDGKIGVAAVTFAVAGLLALFGLIHSPLPSSPMLTPWAAMAELGAQGRLAASASQTPYHWAAAYLLMASILLGIGRWGSPPAGDKEDLPDI